MDDQVDDQVEAPAEAVEEQQETAVNMPAQSFKKSVKAADINNKKTTVTVMVNAPEGALPEKAGMTVDAVGANDVLTGTGRTVLETVKETTEDEVVNLITLEIAFTDADGYEIDPAVLNGRENWSSMVRKSILYQIQITFFI